MTKTGKHCISTTTTMPGRLRIFQPTQRPVYIPPGGSNWIETAWGRVRVSGRLGQRHADIYEALRWCAEDSRELDGQTDLLVDPARVRRSLSEHGYSHGRLWKLLDEIMQAVVEVHTPTVRGMGHLIDSVTESKKTRRDPLTGEARPLWVVRLGLAALAFDRHDLPLRHDPAPVARLGTGIGQAVARHILTHKHQPRGGWTTDGLIRAVAGEIKGQALWDKRRELRADAGGLAALGVLIDGDRVRRMEQGPDNMEQGPDNMEQGPDIQMG